MAQGSVQWFPGTYLLYYPIANEDDDGEVLPAGTSASTPIIPPTIGRTSPASGAAAADRFDFKNVGGRLSEDLWDAVHNGPLRFLSDRDDEIVIDDPGQVGDPIPIDVGADATLTEPVVSTAEDASATGPAPTGTNMAWIIPVLG